jgi:hypothetical protein
MAKRSASKRPAKKATTKTAKKANARKAPAKKKTAAPKAGGSRKAAAKKAARLKAIEKARVAEETAAATVNYEPAPFEAEEDLSKAPGKQHRRPPMSLVGVKSSEAYIAKARTPFIRRHNMGR